MTLSPAVMQFAVFIPIILAFYFLIMRPQQKRQKEQQDLLAGLQVKDRVLTYGGIIGTINKISEDEVVLEISSGVEATLVRSAVTQKLATTQSKPTSPKITVEKKVKSAKKPSVVK